MEFTLTTIRATTLFYVWLIACKSPDVPHSFLGFWEDFSYTEKWQRPVNSVMSGSIIQQDLPWLIE